ncbi:MULTISPECIES: UDP-glucose 4-epimerase GalE [unclassified Lactococcus]|uniref:UDP-glucose 4-epimerase GalE n=1 Tax=unclassified Lactococcus TaxID=2643510 RepID=UPI0011C8F44A|nr:MULTISPECIES: UDP-glucose 4-epimerase GalE [unclassified Lactococcus]MQW22537.1 UDP-glucose 4-epimerase GalE [Lactococcus sp. dk101]TXK45561.1 UDP-glucose 4-epimerase GalE [Lactococcus sp. dk310]TXK51411.1 UDP-glucose 4-epimerase GalE [Lactococcus sp. dk322]
MTVLVLGGAGYVGSHAVEMLVAKGYDVAVVDNLVTGHRAAVPANIRFYEGDVRDRAFMEEVFSIEKNIEGVMHFCAYSLVGESMQKPAMYFDNNVGGCITLLEVMEQFNVKHIVFSSTAATFGIPKESPISEKTPQNPINPYGESKLMMEKMMKWQSEATDMTYVALRYFNVAGASNDGHIGEAHKNETHLIPIILQVALGKRDFITIYGDNYNTPDGTCVRDYIDMEDLINAHIKALEYLKAGGKSDQFNLGSSHGYSNLEVLETARKVTGKEIPSQMGERRPGDPDSLVADSTKAGQILDWHVEHDLEHIIENAWRWHSGHPDGY